MEQARNVFEEVRRRYDDLTQSQKKIAETIVEAPEFVAFATVDQFATRLNISPSTIVRFAYRLGLEGYQDLQDRVRDLVRAKIAAPEVPEQLDALLPQKYLRDSVYQRSFEQDVANIHRTVARLRPETLDKAAEIISTARRVYVVGSMTTRSLALYSALILDRVREDIVLLDGPEYDAVVRLTRIGEHDAVLVFTFPPYASATLRATREAKRCKAAIVAVTDSPLSPVGQLADVFLPSLAAGLSTQNSLVAAMALMNALFNGIIIHRGEPALDRYNSIYQAMSAWDLVILKGEGGTTDAREGGDGRRRPA